MTLVRHEDALIAANPTTIATAVFSNGRAFGSTGCNLYQAPYTISSGLITFGDLALTGSACNPVYATQGDAFVRGIEATDQFAISEDSLELTDAAGAAQIIFRPSAELPLTRVVWQLVWYDEGSAPFDGAEVSLALRDDGTLMGAGGCNSYFADYQIAGDQLVIREIGSSEVVCIDPAGVMSQETDYLDTLGRVAGYATTLTGLELLDADAKPVAEYRFGGRIHTDMSGEADGN